MKTTKVYKTWIGTRTAILMAKIRNLFNGSHYVAETFTTKFNKETKEYTLEHYTMTHDEEQQFNEAMALQQAKIIELAKAEIVEEAPTMQRQKSKEEKWAEDVERNRQKQLAENKSKKPAKPKAKKKPVELSDESAQKIVTDIKNRGVYTETPKMAAKPKRKYNKQNKTNGK